MIINSLWHENNSTSSLWREHITTHKDESVYIKSLYSLISSGTEYLVATGQVPLKAYRAMKVPYMGGRFPFPVKYGYNLIGLSQNQKNEDILMHCMHPHQDIAIINQQDAHLVPPGIQPRQATLFGTLETVINAIWDARLDEIDLGPVLIVGGGLIGMTLAVTMQHVLSNEVLLKEPNLYRQAQAKRLGIQLVGDRPHNYSVCFHTSGTSEGLQYAIDHCSFEGKVIEMSWYGEKKVNLELGTSFHYERKQIISSQVSHIPGHKKKTEDYASRRRLVWKYLQSPVYNQLITEEIPFREAPAFFDRIRKRDHDFLGCLIRY